MNYILFLIPLLSAFIGWFAIWAIIKILFHPKKPTKILGFTLQGIFPGKKDQLANKLGQSASTYFSFGELEEKIISPATYDKIKPVIEIHIDEFLRHRLGKEMPMISMFIGEKTINKMKEALMKEIDNLFPQVMKQFAGNLSKEIDVQKMVTSKISAITNEQLESALYGNLSRELRMARIAGAFMGLLVGLIQLYISIVAN
jgi:uncharacterized membrane protein YheB (UPF0754 family)